MNSETELDFDSMYGTVFLSAADLRGRRTKAKVLDYVVEDLKDKSGDTRRRIVLLLQDEKTRRNLKRWPLNKTCATVLRDGLRSKDPELWIGATLELFSTPTPMGDGIRCSIVSKAPTKSRAGVEDEDSEEDEVEDSGEDAPEARASASGKHPLEAQFDDPEYRKRRERHMRRKAHGRTPA